MTVKDMKRLIADEGKVLTNGSQQGSVIDCLADDVDQWSEIDAPVDDSANVTDDQADTE